MNCRKVTHLLSAYMDGELPGVEHRLIHEHLTHCHDCLADYEDLLQMKRLLGRMRMQSAQRDLPLQIISQIHAQETRAKAEHTTDWINLLLQRLKMNLTTPQSLSLGLGFAVVAVLYMAQLNVSPQHPNDIILQLSSQEFTNGIHYADSERFLSRPMGVRPVSNDAFFPENGSRLFQRRPRSVQLEQLVFRP